MMLADLIKHPLFVALTSLIAGSIIASVINRLRNRMAQIRYFTTVNRVGVSTTDPVFGNIKVSWNDKELRNLHIITLTFENISPVDIGELALKVYTEEQTHLLSERSSIIGTSFIVPYSEAFQKALAVLAGQLPSDLQWKIYLHSREYQLRAFNRFQRGQLTYLCTRPNDDLAPSVWLESPNKGVHVKLIRNPTIGSTPLLGVPTAKSALLGLVTAGIGALACSLFIKIVWPAALISLVAGLLASLLGAIEYKLFDAIRKRLST